MQHTSAMARQRQIRGFVVAWLGVTLLVGALTFAGIYYATGLINNDTTSEDGASVAALPITEDNAAEVPAAADNANLSNAAAQPADGGQPAANPAGESGGAGGNNALAAPPDGQGGGPAQNATAVPTPTPFPDQQQEQPITPPAAAPAQPVDPEAFQVGIQVQSNPDPEVYKIWMGEVRDKLKLKWIKQQVRWADIEPQQGQFDWGALDVTFDQAPQYGINVMVSVVTAPDWAREPGVDLNKVGPPADPTTYANFLTTMLQRYPGEIQAVEVWNEMNIDREWASSRGLSAANYVTLLRTAYQAIKAIDPNIIVISGALSPTGVNDGVGAYDDFVYMDMLIQAGLLTTTDCVGAHHNGYNIGPNVPWNNVPNDPTARFRGPFDNPHHSWSFYSTLNGYADKIKAAGSDTKLCITEFGWPVTEDLGGTPRNFEFADDNTLAEQAQFFDEAIQSMDEWGFVWLAFIWNLNYGPQAGWDATNDNVPYSLLRPEWKNAPAYDVIAKYNFRGE